MARTRWLCVRRIGSEKSAYCRYTLSPSFAARERSAPLRRISAFSRARMAASSEKSSARMSLAPESASDGRARLALGTVGAINVLELGKRLRALYGARQLVRPFVLRLNGLGDFLPARVQPTQGRELLGKLAQRLVVGVPMHFLAIAGDKGNGRAAVEQLDHVLRVRGLHMILRCKRKCVFVHVVPPLYVFVRFNPL